MINFIDKPGLDALLQRAGYSIIEYPDGFRVSHGGMESAAIDAAAQALIDAYSLDDAKKHKCAAVQVHSKMLRDRVVAAISAGEMASWPIKASEAARFGATGDASQCPLLSSEAAARGVSVAELVGKVNGNAARFTAAEAAIGGTDGKHRDAINALETFEAVAAYDISTGWPVV